MTTTLLTWRGTWTPWGTSRSSARSYGWRTSNSWTAISRNWRNLLFEETTRSSSLNTWVYDRIYIYRMNKSLFYVRNNSSRSSKRMEDEIKSAGVVVHVYFLERINRIIHFPSWIDPRQFPISPSPPLVPRLVRQKLFEASSQIYPFVSSKPILISSLCRIRCWKWKVWWWMKRGTSDLPIGAPPMWVVYQSN